MGQFWYLNVDPKEDASQPKLVGGFNHPIWKICSSKWESSPIFGMKIKNIWNHHLEKSPAIHHKKPHVSVFFFLGGEGGDLKTKENPLFSGTLGGWRVASRIPVVDGWNPIPNPTNNHRLDVKNLKINGSSITVGPSTGVSYRISEASTSY